MSAHLFLSFRSQSGSFAAIDSSVPICLPQQYSIYKIHSSGFPYPLRTIRGTSSFLFRCCVECRSRHKRILGNHPTFGSIMSASTSSSLGMASPKMPYGHCNPFGSERYQFARCSYLSCRQAPRGLREQVSSSRGPYGITAPEKSQEEIQTFLYIFSTLDTTTLSFLYFCQELLAHARLRHEVTSPKYKNS